MGRGLFSLQRTSYILCTIVFLIVTLSLFMQTDDSLRFVQTSELILIDGAQDNSTDKINEWLERRKNLKGLSKLGRILFMGEDEPKIIDTNEKYKILVWKYGPMIENRHLKGFSGKIMDPFAQCSVKNCDITYSDSSLKTADIVIFHLHRMKSLEELPKQRDPNQIWAFLTDESPHHTFLSSKLKIADLNGIFNWSMTYRLDADIPVPYGRTIIKSKPNPVQILLNKKKDVLVAVLGSNCGGKNKRWDYIRELQKYIKVDVYGGCGKLKTCPGHFKSDCPDIGNYLFYLSFENSNCDNYITEKLWWNAYQKNSIPIVMGANPSDYAMLLPPESYINVDDFASPSVLAQYIYRLNATEEYRHYFKWKKNFDVLNEHGYFHSKSYHYCRICQALNFNDRTNKIYLKLEDFWSVKRDCHPAWNDWKE